MSNKNVVELGRTLAFVVIVALHIAIVDTATSAELLLAGEPVQMSAEEIVTLPERRHDNLQMELRYKTKNSWRVYLALTIDERGRVKNVDVAIPSGSAEFDAAVIGAFGQAGASYTPGTIRGKPKTMQVLMPVTMLAAGKESELEENERLSTPLVSAWHLANKATVDEWRKNALEDQSRELAERRALYPREAPYRILPSKQVSDSELAARLYQAYNRHTHCGNSIIQKGRISGWHEYRDVQTLVSARKLTEVDHLNGYEWKGTVEMKYRFYRHRDDSSIGWSEWQKGSYRVGDLVKKNGKWSIGHTNIMLGDPSDTPAFITCSDVPK